MMRIGYGYDSHRFDASRPLILGGVSIPGAPGLKGHSDADVLIHAVIDALLGAAALGDIGSHFPDDDPRWSGADSARLLESVVEEIHSADYRVVNVDATVVCERPKLRPYIDEMRRRLSELLKIPMDCVSVKGKTNEKMDAVGEGIGIMVHCVALLERTGESGRDKVLSSNGHGESI